jgi:hypothetical protein
MMSSMPEKSPRELLQEAVNQNTVSVAANGFAAVDELLRRGRRKLEGHGITGLGEIETAIGRKLKRSLAEALTGRQQP